MAQIADRLQRVLTSLPQGVSLTAVSKFHPIEQLREAYDAGQRIFGESRAQELVQKVPQMPADTEWHFIGHLQTNKVRQVLPLVHTIQSVDSERLLAAIDAEAARIGRTDLRVLLQVHVAMEETKSGFLVEELLELAPLIAERYPHVVVGGVMGMASNTDDMERVRRDFEAIASAYRALAYGPYSHSHLFNTLSMGMSHDYPLAVECGSNMVRIGTDIFGERL